MRDKEVRASDYRWTILAVTLVGLTASGGLTQGLPTLVSFFRVDLNLSRTEIGLLNSASAFGIMASLLAAGWMTDLLGARRLMLVGLVSAGCILGTVALAHSFLAMALILLLAGVATAMASPGFSKTIVVWFPSRERGFAMGLQRTGIPLMGALAAAILPSVALAFGWRIAVLALAATVVLAGCIAFSFYRDSPTPLASGETRVRPGSPWKLFRNRNILLASILPAALVAAQFCLVNYLVLYLTETLGAPVVVAGGSLATAQVAGMVGRLLWGVVSDRVFRGGRRDVLLLVGFLSTLLLAAMGFLPPGTPLWIVTLMAVGLGVLALGWHGVYTVFLPELSGKELAGSAVGLGSTLVQAGAVAGPPLFGYVVDLTGDYRWGWRALALLAAAGTALLLLVREPRKR